MNSINLIIYSLLPTFLIGLYLYKKDNNKESKKLIIKLLLGGFLAVVLTLFLSYILSFIFPIFNQEYTELTNKELIIYSFIYVALIEEISKWIMLYIIGYKNKENDEPYDILLYGALIGLGFAGIENILYVFTGGMTVAIIRAFTAVPMHAMQGIIMGYYLGTSTNKINYKSIIIPIIIHGIYDYLLLGGGHLIISITILIILLIYTTKLINRIGDKFNSYKEIYCPQCGGKYSDNYCVQCGRKRK